MARNPGNARPLVFRGVRYPSLRAAHDGAHVGYDTIRKEAVWIAPPPKPPTRRQQAVARILEAAELIREQAGAQDLEGGGTTVEIDGRRAGLVRAIYNHRRRFGVGVLEG